MKKIPYLILAALLCGPPAGRSQQGESPDVDPAADRILRKMSARLSAAEHLTIEAERSIGGQLLPDAALKRDAKVSVRVSRPAGISAVIDDGQGIRELHFDGEQVVILDRTPGIFAKAELAGTNDEAIDALSDRWGIEPALADLIVSDPYASLTSAAQSGKVAGVESLGGAECDHLHFAVPGLEWEIWIGKEDSLPRRFLIRYVALEGAPTIMADNLRIDLETTHDPGIHKPEIEDLQQVELLPTTAEGDTQ